MKLRFSSRSNMLIDLECIAGIPFTDCFCMYSVKEITETISTPANEKKYSFRPGSNYGLIDIMAWKQFIHLSRKLLLVTAGALKPELAAIYLLICIMLTLSEAIALISSVYYCTHWLHKESNLTQFTSAAGLQKERGSFLLWERRGQTLKVTGEWWVIWKLKTRLQQQLAAVLQDFRIQMGYGTLHRAALLGRIGEGRKKKEKATKESKKKGKRTKDFDRRLCPRHVLSQPKSHITTCI